MLDNVLRQVLFVGKHVRNADAGGQFILAVHPWGFIRKQVQ